MVSDSGPTFWNKFISNFWDMHIDYMASKTYKSSRNGWAERFVAIVKHMLQLIPPKDKKELQNLTQAIILRTSRVSGAGFAYERLFGRKPLLNLPCLPSQLTNQQKETMAQKMSEHRDMYQMKY